MMDVFFASSNQLSESGKLGPNRIEIALNRTNEAPEITIEQLKNPNLSVGEKVHEPNN